MFENPDLHETPFLPLLFSGLPLLLLFQSFILAFSIRKILHMGVSYTTSSLASTLISVIVFIQSLHYRGLLLYPVIPRSVVPNRVPATNPRFCLHQYISYCITRFLFRLNILSIPPVVRNVQFWYFPPEYESVSSTHLWLSQKPTHWKFSNFFYEKS